MIILDTNVLSEVMRPEPSPRVIKWIDRQSFGELFTTAITVGEIYCGIELLPRGRRRDKLFAAAETIFNREFLDRALAFNAEAARVFSRIYTRRRFRGRPISQSDAQIAAIVQLHGATLATRNIADFESCSIDLFDPWQDE
jgi:predicted nucleic acid-binding protein